MDTPGFGDAVKFESFAGLALGFLLTDRGDTKFDVQWFHPQNGAGSVAENVPRNDDGGQGHTWRPVDSAA